MELGLISIVGMVVLAVIAIYYGMGKNVEVASRMLTRELTDAERLQKERIVRKYATKDSIKDADFAKAVKAIDKIDELDI